MQKKIIALAVAALASTAAFAQTNVTVYGVADGSFDVIQIDKSLNQGNNVGDFNRVSANSSYLGFKGTEDLGNGLKAVFQFESSVAFDSTGGTIAARDSYVGLSSAFGTVVMGNLTGPTRALGAGLDVNAGATGIGANSGIIGKLTGSTPNCAKSAICTSAFDTRWSNTIAYVSPNFAGFSGVAAYVADENKTEDGANNTAGVLRTTGYDVGVKWEGAGFMAGIAYNWFQAGNLAGTDADNLRLGGSYKGAWGSVNLMWEETKANGGVYGTSSGNKQQKWGVGGAFNIGKAAIIGQYYQALESDNIKNDGAFLAEVGAVYNLSKRSSLKAVYAYLDNESAGRADFGVNASGVNGSGSTLQGLQLGLRHNF
jgi:predicted porin